MAKYNQLLRIEEQLGDAAIYGGPLFKRKRNRRSVAEVIRLQDLHSSASRCPHRDSVIVRACSAPGSLSPQSSSLPQSAGYTLYRVFRPGITDSVWFWLFAFSATGLIGLLAVSPKYDDRQKRLEARYEGRQRAHEAAQPPRSRSRETSDSNLQYDYQDHLRVPLHFLASALAIAVVATVSCLSALSTTRHDDCLIRKLRTILHTSEP